MIIASLTKARLACIVALIFVLWASTRPVRLDTLQGFIPTDSLPFAIAVNPVTNKIYVANFVSNNVTVIDGTNNSTTPVPAGSFAHAVAA
jgi:YVTN family beta-propeller protein